MKGTFPLLLVLVVLLVFAGCISGGSSSLDQPISRPAQESGFEFSEKSMADQTSSIDRMVIFTANLNIEVEDFEYASESVEKIAMDAGGFVSNSNAYITSTDRMRGSLTLRIPEKNFNNVLDLLEGVGKVKSKTVSGEDVTEEYIDLDARLRNLYKQEDRILELFDRAEEVEDLLKVEKELGRIRGEIESLEGRKRFLDDRIDLTTIRVDLFEPEPITTEFGLRAALRNSVEGFISTTTGLIIFTGSILPIVIFLAFIGSIIYIIRKR